MTSDAWFSAAGRVVWAAYFVLPAWAVLARRRGGNSVWPTVVAGVSVGVGLVVAYGVLAAGRATAAVPGEFFATGWVATGWLLATKTADSGVRAGLSRLRAWAGMENRNGRALSLLVRAAVLVTVFIPFVLSAVMVWRPRVEPWGNPATELGLAYEAVRIESDGVELAGWWIVPPGYSDGDVSSAVVISHGLGGGKADVLGLAGFFAQGGFGTLVMDARAHGASGGRLTTLGGRERRDVSAAAAWVKSQVPGVRLHGLGISAGGAAVLGARDGSGLTPFESVATVSTFAALEDLVSQQASRLFVGPLGWIASRVAVPAVSVHAGVDVSGVRPEAWAADLGVPLLIVHGTADNTIGPSHGRRLAGSAGGVVRTYWHEDGDHLDTFVSPAVLQEIDAFFRGSIAVRGVARAD